MKLPASECVLGSWLPELRRCPASLQASESVMCSLLTGEAQKSPVWLQASESVLCSRLSGEAQWVAFAPVDDGPNKSDVVSPLACGSRQHSRFIGTHRGVFAPGRLTTGSTEKQPLAFQSAPPFTVQRPSMQHPDNSLQPHGICWYHWQFGKEARK